MPINITISGGDAAEAMRELRDFSAPFHDPYAAVAKALAENVYPAGASSEKKSAQDEYLRLARGCSADAAAQDVVKNADGEVVKDRNGNVVASFPAAVPERDADGLPWDERIHAGSKALNADGTWRKKRNVMDALVQAVEAELRKQMATAEAKETATSEAEEAENVAPAGQTEDSPEDQAQDAEDEKAEADAVREERIAKDPEKVLTHDDVRAALGEYVKKFGMGCAQEDGPRILAAVLTGDVSATNDGKPFKVSDVPDDQAVLKKAVDGIHEALTKNVFKRGAA